MDPWNRFLTTACGGETDQTPVALIVDSPWLPGYIGVDTLDYFLHPDVWWRANLDLLTRFPDVAWIPGFWVEYGMAVEPSAFGDASSGITTPRPRSSRCRAASMRWRG